MASVNKAMLFGVVASEPAIRKTDGATAAAFTLETSYTKKDGSTEKEQHRISAFGKAAEIIESQLKKGEQVYVEGYLQTRKYQNKAGKDQYITEVIVGIISAGGEAKKATRQAGAEFDDDIPY